MWSQNSCLRSNLTTLLCKSEVCKLGEVRALAHQNLRGEALLFPLHASLVMMFVLEGGRGRLTNFRWVQHLEVNHARRQFKVNNALQLGITPLPGLT